MRNQLWLVILTLPFLCSLSGCLPMVVAGAGTAVAVKQDSIKKDFSDSNIKYTITNKIFADKELYGNNHIIVTVVNGNVLLAGQVRNNTYRQQVVTIAENLEGVKQVYDQLTITEPTSLGQQANDSLITTKVKTRILANVGTGITVVTEDNTVYLMGNVSRENAEKATEIARTTNGVAKVVQIFTYLPVTAQQN